MAKGSSKDSSTSRGVKELSHSNGGLFQSNSISLIVNQSAIQCDYNVFTSHLLCCQALFEIGVRNLFRRTVRPLNAPGQSQATLVVSVPVLWTTVRAPISPGSADISAGSGL